MKNIDKEVEQTLSSLDGIVPADPGPYFYTRLSARLQPDKALKPIWKWAIACTEMTLTILPLLLKQV